MRDMRNSTARARLDGTLACAQVAADNGGAKGFVDLLVQRFAASPVDGNHRRESARYLSHPRNIVVITVCRQVVIVSDHFLGRNYRSRAKVQLLPPSQFGLYPGKPVIAFGKGLAHPLDV